MISLVTAAIGCGLMILVAITYYGDTIKSGYRLSTEFYDALDKIDCKEKVKKCPEYLQ